MDSGISAVSGASHLIRRMALEAETCFAQSFSHFCRFSHGVAALISLFFDLKPVSQRFHSSQHTKVIPSIKRLTRIILTLTRTNNTRNHLFRSSSSKVNSSKLQLIKFVFCQAQNNFANQNVCSSAFRPKFLFDKFLLVGLALNGISDRE